MGSYEPYVPQEDRIKGDYLIRDKSEVTFPFHESKMNLGPQIAQGNCGLCQTLSEIDPQIC